VELPSKASLWEWGFDGLFAAPVAIAAVLWYFTHLPGWVVLAVFGVILVVAILLFPYITKFDLKTKQ